MPGAARRKAWPEAGRLSASRREAPPPFPPLARRRRHDECSNRGSRQHGVHLLVHLFGAGLADERYVVERFKAHADGDIRPWPCEAPAKGKRRGAAKRVTATLKAVKEMRPTRTEIIVCSGLRTRGGQQLWGDLATSLWHDRRQRV